MNKGLALSKLIEDARYRQNEKRKDLIGAITDPESFGQNLAALDTLHSGLFSFVAFHPKLDAPVAEYIEKGSIGSDSGPNILVLFLSTKEMRRAQDITLDYLNLGVTLDPNIHPAYRFASWLFPGGAMPKLPGLVFFDHASNVVKAVYVPIVSCDTAREVADYCKSVFVLADGVVRERRAGEEISIDSLCRKLNSNGIQYSRNGRTSIGEWLVILYGFAKEHAGEIASVVMKMMKLE